MKIIFPLVLALAAALPAGAQSYPTDRGSFLLGGSASVNTAVLSTRAEGETTRERVTVAQFQPDVQYFVLPGLALGGSAGLSTDFDGATAFAIGPQVSYYFGRGERRAYPYLSAGVSYQGLSSDDPALGQNAAVGGVFMVSRAVGLDAGVRYSGFGFDQDGTRSRIDSFALALGFTAFAF